MNREFLFNAVFLILVNLLIKPFYVFGIERTIQDTVGAESYGLYATLFSFTFLLFMINDFGIHYFNNRNIARHPQLAAKYFPNILVLKTLLTLAYIAAVFLAAIIRGFSVDVYYLLFFIALNHVLISMVAFLRSNISGLGMYRTDSAISTMDKLLLIVVCAILLWGPWQGAKGGFQIRWFVHAQNFAWLSTAAVAFFIVKKHIPHRLAFRVRWPFLLAVLKKSAPYALAVFLMTAYTRFDIVVLEWMLPDGRYEAGVYAAGYRLLDAFNMVGYLFAGLLLPMFSTLLKKQYDSSQASTEVVSLLRFSLQMIWAGTIPLTAACFFFREELMLWLYPATATVYYGDVLAFIMLTLVPFSGIFIYSTLLTANDSLKKMNRLFGWGILLNLSLNLLLIPTYKAVGAGFSAFATQTFVMVSMMVLAKRELELPFDSRQFLKITEFVLAVVLTNWLIYQYMPAGWLLKFVAAVAGGLSLSFFLRLVQIKTFLQLAKR